MTESTPNKSPKKLVELKAQRSTTRACISRIKTLIDAKAETFSEVELECRLGILESYFKQILSYQTSIEKHLPDDANEQKIRGELEDQYCAIKARLMTLLAGQRKASMNFDSSTVMPNVVVPNLPKLKLPSFDGKYSEFPNFLGTFTKLVDNNATLSAMEKFNHLLTCLHGPALRTIQGFEVTDSNYPKAVELLKMRYNNKYLIVQEHLSSLFNMPRVAKNSPAQLRFLIDSTCTHVSSLLNLGSPEEVLNALIVHLVSSKLDIESQGKWEASMTHSDLPSWPKCANILNQHSQCLEARNVKQEENQELSTCKLRQPSKARKPNYTLVTTSSRSCSCCQAKEHQIYRCSKFKELSVAERFELVKSKALCTNCLAKGHGVKKCRQQKCKVCRRPHHTLLHRYTSDGSVTEPSSNSSGLVQSSSSNSGSPGQANLASSLLSNNHDPGKVLLAVAVVKVKDQAGRWHMARALLDSASQLNFICEYLVQSLKLKRTKVNTDISGIGNAASNSRWATEATIQSRLNQFQVTVPMHILPQITGLQPERTFSIDNWNLPANVELADPAFFKAQKVDILIGTSLFFQLLCVGQIKLGDNLPTLQKTVFGWLVAGTYANQSGNQTVAACTTTHPAAVRQDSCEDNLSDLVERFWDAEEIHATPSPLSEEHAYCENLFIETTQRLPDGRFMVKLPFILEPHQELGASRSIALKRLCALERKLMAKPDVKTMYSEFLREYLRENHMEKIDESAILDSHYFLPHRCVLRPDKSTTKLRVVFDASCPTSSSKSLNDLLMVGPVIQDELFSILIRFRCHRYALTADISAMYRQILVTPEDRNYQLILWREKPTDDIQIYRLKTVTYGTASAPFLATRCLRQLATEFASVYPIASEVVRNDFYMDDLLSGADTAEELHKLRKEVDIILRSAKFSLRKWYSNDLQLLSAIPEDQREKLLRLHDTDVLKTLGVIWEPRHDEFRFFYKTPQPITSSSSAVSKTMLSSAPALSSSSSLNSHSTSRSSPSHSLPKVTKRIVLSETARLFDPLGLINPVVVLAKLFLQQLWLLKLNWDESLPQELASRWIIFTTQLSQLNDIKVPRLVTSKLSPTHISLHGFSDASLKAYGSCIYLRTIDDAGQISVNLLAAKSKIAPSKVTRSLPCLELCGALLLARLYDKIKSNISKRLDATYLWSDAEIVLDWLRSHASNWKVYVANRASEIQRLTPNVSWRYVNSSANPADLISRGVMPSELNNTRWFNGPEFLYKPEELWPLSRKRHVDLETLPEKRKLKTVLICLVDESFVSTICNFSDFNRNCRRFAFVLRFVDNLRAKRVGRAISTQPLLAQDVDKAFIKIVWALQQREFASEIARLQHEKPTIEKGSISHLAPFLDTLYNVKVLRVGGRLFHSDLTPDRKFPILLPRRNKFVESYIRHLHIKNYHAGPSALVAILQQRFWVINARDYSRNIVRKCIHCFRYRPQLSRQIMGNLPRGRINVSPPFTHTGVDFCGPINTTYGLRGRSSYKSYIAIFVCFATRAVHIEVVSDLTSEAFIAALKRFTARRNLCQYLYCDNATNFVGAKRQLQEFSQAFLQDKNQKQLHNWCSRNTIEFRLIPPRAPHFGGLWEAAVKVAKAHLIRTLRNSLLTYEELSTVLAQIEGILNSRPITPISSDPNDLQALTPAHFLNQAPLETFPEPLYEINNISYLRRWQRVSSYHQHFWQRWSQEYIHLLQQRKKWSSSHPSLQCGDMVLIHDDNLPPYKWNLGRIVNVVPGTDGHVRVVDVKTKSGTIRRSIHKLALLPSQEEIPRDVESS